MRARMRAYMLYSDGDDGTLTRLTCFTSAIVRQKTQDLLHTEPAVKLPYNY